MRIASLPSNEDLRLQDLYSYEILDSEKENDFDELLEVAAYVYGCPIAAVTFIDKERQWLKSTIGIADDTQETSRDVAFCAHTILHNDVLIVEDATKDDRFCNNPFVTNDPSIRFYAGAPIVSANGYRLGSICVIDQKPRELTQQEARMLQILSRQVSKLLELRSANKRLRKKAEEQLELEHQLLQKTLQEHEAEKKSISTELHENIAQALAATKFYLEMAEDDGVAAKALIRKSRDTVVTLVRQIRELSHSISPALLPDVELKLLLHERLSQFHNQSGLETLLHYDGDKCVAARTALLIYRMVETQLHNVQSHAKATSVTVSINIGASVHLLIRDNGVGFDRYTFQRGAGLNKILSHAAALKGNVEITSGVKGGCELAVVFPKPQIG
ncbi:MAG TPA: GAF domain-containing protein [Flavisolibacter sp.]